MEDISDLNKFEHRYKNMVMLFDDLAYEDFIEFFNHNYYTMFLYDLIFQEEIFK